MRVFKYVAVNESTLVRVPDNYLENNKPHIGRVDNNWFVVWPNHIQPTVAEARDFLPFMKALTGVQRPSPPPTYVEASERVQ